MAKIYSRHYREYRGRRKKRSIPLIVVTGLLAAVLAAVIVFVYVLDGSIQRTEDGIRFVVPSWEIGEEAEDSLPPLVID